MDIQSGSDRGDGRGFMISYSKEWVIDYMSDGCNNNAYKGV